MGRNDNFLEWLATWISIACSLFRALNFGYQGWVYLISISTYLVFIANATKKSQVILNVFYIATALMGAYRWGLH
jgi:hypothetical protein